MEEYYLLPGTNEFDDEQTVGFRQCNHDVNRTISHIIEGDSFQANSLAESTSDVPTAKADHALAIRAPEDDHNDVPTTWLPGHNRSNDEQNIGFKGIHSNKLRISYKKEGDGFQSDCLSDAGLTISCIDGQLERSSLQNY